MELSSRRQLSAVIAGCFFASGLAGLVYQVLWVRVLVLVFGVTNLAVSTVLTAFMGGLALGSYIGGRCAGRMSRPLVVYGALQVLIGLYGLLIPTIFERLSPLYNQLWLTFHPGFWTFSLVRFGIAAAVLIIPATAMGATLPTLSRFFAQERERAGFDIGRLYGLNTLGAVFGALAPAFVLLPLLGVGSSILLVAILNLSIGALAIVVGWPQRQTPAPRQLTAAEPSAIGQQDWRTRVALVAFGVSGFVGLVYEVAYTRFLVQVVPSTTYAFSIMLATFLVGLALGSLGGSYVSRRSANELFILGALQLFIGVAVYASASLFKEMPYVFFASTRRVVGTRSLPVAPLFAISAAVVGLPTLFMGAMFPLVVKLCTRDLRFVGRSVGSAFAANTVGSIAGSFAAGFLLMPALGLIRTFMVGMSLNLALAVLLVSLSQARRSFKIVAAAAAGLGLLNVFAFAPVWKPTMIRGGRFHVPAERLRMSRQQFKRWIWLPDALVLAHRDGVEATVSVMEDMEGIRGLLSNGRSEGSTHTDMPTQVLLGAVPMAIAPKTDDVLVIGFATGTTVGSVLNFPGARVVAAELEPAMIEYSRFFEPLNGSPLRELGGRLSVELNDARNLLLVDSRVYDLIISEPSNLFVSGITNLFSRDFYALAKSRLRPDGVFAQWIQGYTLDESTLRVVLRTFEGSFTSVFKAVYVFRIGDSDYCVIGSEKPLWVDTQELERRLSIEAVRKDLARVGISSPAELMSTFLLGTDEVKSFVATGPQRINTDDNLYLELQAPKDFWLMSVNEVNLKRFLEVSGGEYPHLIYAAGNEQRQKWLIDSARWRAKRWEYPVVRRLAERAISLGPSPEAHALLAEAWLADGEVEKARAEWDSILRQSSKDVPTLLRYAEHLLGTGDAEMVVHFAERAVEAEPDNARAHFYLGWGLSRQGRKADGATQFEIALKDQEFVRSQPELLYNLAFCELDATVARYESAEKRLEEYTKLRLTDAMSFYYLGIAKYYLGKTREAVSAWQRAGLLAERQAQSSRAEASMYARSRDLVRAAQGYKEALKLFGSDKQTYWELAEVLWRSGDPDQTTATLKAMLELFPDDPVAYRRLGDISHWKGDAEAAIESYTKAAALESNPLLRQQIESTIERLRLEILKTDTDSGGQRVEP